MSAVIRVKRRIDEEPLNAFVLNCKRRKLEESENHSSNDNETSTILKFAGTVNNQDEFIRLTKEDAKQIITKSRKPDLSAKSRNDVKQNTQNSRFKIVNCSRPVDFEAENKITVVDIEKQLSDDEEENKNQASTSTSRKPITNDSTQQTDGNYVYDVYIPDSGTEANIDDNLVENLLSVQPFDLVYDRRDYGNKSESEDEHDSDDSNSESNWRNDYPDSDNSIDVDDMRNAVEKFEMDDDNLSSDDDDEEAYKNGFVYSIDSENISFEDDIDYCDVNRYGEAYARYKATVIKKTLRDDSNEEISDLDDYYD